MRRVLGQLGVSLIVAAVAFGSAPEVAGAGPAAPTVSGPVPGSPSLVFTSFDLAPFGYVQEEFFFGGEATAYTPETPLTEDGRWTVTPASTAPFTTRMVVVRPEDPKDFDGTVYVEWFNVSAGYDNAPNWTQVHLELLRQGAAWVGVSAQAVGVQGGQTVTGDTAAGGLKGGDPQRYGSLSHPGDSYSYDIFTQAARVVRGEGSAKVLGPLTAKRVIATGQSQAAIRLVTYIDAVQPRSEAFDGFLIHSRYGGAGAPLSQTPLAAVPAPSPTWIRADLGVPVMVFQTETDTGLLGAAAARQPDTKWLRTWEAAGTAHADVYTTLGFGDTGDGSAEVALLDYTKPSPGPLGCATPINAGPRYAVLMAAVRHLDEWVRRGTLPPKGTPLAVPPGPVRTPSGQTVPNFLVPRDERGVALGGIRTPHVDAPRAALTGELNAGGQFCSLFGTTVPFDAATIDARYPSRDAFVAEFRRAAKRAVKGGFLLPEEAKKMLDAVTQVPYGA